MLEPQKANQKAPQAPKLSIRQRLQLINTLNQLPPSQLLAIEATLQPPPRQMSELSASQAQRSAWLFRYLEGFGGSGLSPLLEVLENMDIKPFAEDAHPQKFDLQFADLRGADLRGTDLSEANLRSAKLRRATLSHAVLSHADFSYAVLSRAIFRNADLSGAILSGALLSDAVLCGAVLQDTDLSDALVGKATFGNNPGITEQDKADLKQRGAIFQDLPGPNEPVLST
ncbi:MAG: pentapeptide repeat-containing protein [Cyanobacteria bacterium P01_F01_bin.86]